MTSKRRENKNQVGFISFSFLSSSLLDLISYSIILLSFCSRHVAICLVRTMESASLCTKQTAMFASVMMDSQGNTAKWVRTIK